MACNNPITAFYQGINKDGKMQISYKRGSHGFPVLMDCGRCIGCRLTKAKQWAVRCMKELEYYDKACFVTLTYNNLCLPKYTDYETGEHTASIVRNHIIQFNKRLRTALSRKGFTDKIKIYYCGEYGDANHRPHY